MISDLDANRLSMESALLFLANVIRPVVFSTSVAACNATFPVPDACTHFTVNSFPADAAL